jgi:hypothetical protein
MAMSTSLNSQEEIPYHHSQSRESYRVPCSLLVWYRLRTQEPWLRSFPIQEGEGNNGVDFIRGNIRVGKSDPFLEISQLTKLYPLQGGAIATEANGTDIPLIRALKGEAINLSADGLLLKGEKPVQPGQILDLSLYLPTSPPHALLLAGAVVWTDSLEARKAGIRFVDLTEEYKEQIISFVFYQQRQIRRQQLLYQGN